MSGAQLLLFIVSNIYLIFLREPAAPILCLCAMAINPLIAIGLSFFVREDLRRLSSVLSVSMISNQSRTMSKGVMNDSTLSPGRTASEGNNLRSAS